MLRRINRFAIAGATLGIVLGALTNAGANDAGDSPHAGVATGRDEKYRALLGELAAERRHIDELEKKVRELEAANNKIEQTQATIQSSDTQTQNQVAAIQKTVDQQLGPFQFGDRINAFLGQHTFSLVGNAAAGFAYSRVAANNNPTFEINLNPIIRLGDWINFYGRLHAEVAAGGTTSVAPNLANVELFPFGWNVPLELVAGLFDAPFGDFFENQYVNWINPFITAPLPYGSEAVTPASGLGLQARGGIQFGSSGQDVDYTLWADSGPTFESAPGINAIPAPVIGEVINQLTGLNLATNGKGFGARFRVFPLPVELGLGRLEVMTSTYDGNWRDSLGYESWGAGFVYRVGPFRTRGEWAQSYRAMPHLSAAAYPGCCGHDNRQGWFVQAGYELYGIPHPDLGDFFERRLDKGEILVRYSGVNQRAIVASDISDLASPDSNGSPAVFEPHAREVAFAFDYWLQPSIVWKTEVDLELLRAGGQMYTFGSAAVPRLSSIGNTENDVAVMTQIAVGF
jgi:hypothetical protein